MIKAFILTGSVTMIVLVFISGCSNQDEYKKELTPVPKDVKFTPSETSRITPVGMDGK
jgi:hypothetical protein